MKKNPNCRKYAHLWQVNSVNDIFSRYFECEVLISRNLNNTYKLGNLKIIKSSNYLILFKALFLAKNYDFIYLNSSPEYPDYPKNFKSLILFFFQILSFYLLTIFCKKKVICI